LFGAGVYAEPLPLRAIIALDGADCTLRRCSPAQAAVQLFRRANVAERSLAEIAGLASLFAGIPAYRIGRGDVARMCALVREAAA